jgi:xanthine/uracil permease
LTIVLVAVALFWDAPLEQLANPLLTPNPAKAPWYFLGLQELLHYFPPIVAGVLIPTLVVLGLVVIPYFEINVQGEPLWSGNRQRRTQVLVGVVIVLGVLLAVYDAWTVLVPTVLVGVLALLPYFTPSNPARFVQFLRSRTVSWWVMTWFIAVALTLTLVGTFFRGPGWSWVWPWSRHAS